MNKMRREFLTTGAASIAAIATGMAVAGCSKEEPKEAAKDGDKPATPVAKAMVGACGLSCNACPAMKAGKCKGCASGKEASAEMVAAKPCPVLKCAAMKKIDYCGADCKMFTKCPKLIGKPYDKSFMEMMDKKLGATT